MKKKVETGYLRLNPEKHLCPAVEAPSTKLCPAPARDEMGVSVLDNCAEDHIM